MLKKLFSLIGWKPASLNSRGLDFSRIYEHWGFGGKESRSGTGSTLEQTAELRKQLPEVFTKYSITSLIDIPCGDLNWLSSVDLGSISYIGYDIVAPLINENTKRFDSRYTFRVGDIRVGPLPTVDLIFCRDCLVHMPFPDIINALAVIKRSGSTWLMTTTFTGHQCNVDLDEKGWRPLDMQLKPFYLPQPALLINEKCTENEGKYFNKSMGLWRIAEL